VAANVAASAAAAAVAAIAVINRLYAVDFSRRGFRASSFFL
jgi:hypothetical protein